MPENTQWSTRNAKRKDPDKIVSMRRLVRVFAVCTFILYKFRIVTVELQWLEHWWLVYHGCFELVLESLGKNSIAAALGLFRVIFFIILKKGIFLFSLESL